MLQLTREAVPSLAVQAQAQAQAQVEQQLTRKVVPSEPGLVRTAVPTSVLGAQHVL